MVPMALGRSFYLTASPFLNRESMRLGGEKVPFMPCRHFSSGLVTVDARTVHTRLPNIKVEDVKLRFSFLSGLFYRPNNVTNRRWERKNGLIRDGLTEEIESGTAGGKDRAFFLLRSLRLFHLQMNLRAIGINCTAADMTICSDRWSIHVTRAIDASS